MREEEGEVNKKEGGRRKKWKAKIEKKGRGKQQGSVAGIGKNRK